MLKVISQIYICILTAIVFMSKKNIEEIPSQIISKQTYRINLRKNLISTKFNWLMKYLSKQNQQSTQDKNYLMTSIKMNPQKRQNSKKFPLKENQYAVNRSSQYVICNGKTDAKTTLQHKYNSIRNRLHTQQVENISKKRGRNTSLLLHSTNQRQTFNFLESDMRKFGQNIKSDLQIYRRRYKKDAPKVNDCQQQFDLTPWNLNEDKENIIQYRNK